MKRAQQDLDLTAEALREPRRVSGFRLKRRQGKDEQETDAQESGLRFALDLMVSREVAPHPAAGRADADCVAWAKRFHLATERKALRKVAGIHCGSCAAHTYPHATDDVVRLGARLITWLYLFDDAHGEGPKASDARDLMEILTSYSTSLRSGLLPADATEFHIALADIRADALQLSASLDWVHRLAGSFDRYFGGCVMEYYARLSDHTIDLREYRRLRSWSIGTFPVFDLIELSRQQLMPLDASRPELERIRDRAALLCAWANDIYSHDKETNDGDPVNLVSVLAREYQLSQRDAFGAAAEVFNIDLALFEQERDLLIESGSPALSEYCLGLEEWIFGNLKWTALCERYRGEVAEPS